MILMYTKQWLVTVVLLFVPKVNLQISMQVYHLPPPAFGVPGPPNVAMPMPPLGLAAPSMPFQIALPMALPVEQPRETTTTTTTQRNIAVAFPMSIPFPIQFAVPAYPPPQACKKRPRPNNCPVCPPCLCNPCTPSFFAYCSPCHKKCRCRNRNDVPEPLPQVPPVQAAVPAFPIPIPAPAFLPSGIQIPVHDSQLQSQLFKSVDSNENIDYSNSNSDECASRRRRSRRNRRKPSYRRSMNVETNDDEFVKPVLSYISPSGDVKIEKPLSKDEAAELIDENHVHQRVYVTAVEDSNNEPRIKIMSQFENNSNENHYRRRLVALKSGSYQNMLSEGKKELVFKPPADKKISNLSVSFQIV